MSQALPSVQRPAVGDQVAVHGDGLLDRLRRVLDDHVRAGGPEVGRAAGGGGAVPGEGGLGEVGLELCFAGGGVLIVGETAVLIDELQERDLLLGGHRRAGQPFSRGGLAVLPGAEDQVDVVAAEHSLALLGRIEGVHQRDGLVLDVAERPDGAAVGGVRGGLRADEARGQRQVVAVHGGVDRDVVTAELPLPGLACGRFADDRDVVVLLAEVQLRPAAAAGGERVVGSTQPAPGRSPRCSASPS